MVQCPNKENGRKAKNQKRKQGRKGVVTQTTRRNHNCLCFAYCNYLMGQNSLVDKATSLQPSYLYDHVRNGIDTEGKMAIENENPRTRVTRQREISRQLALGSTATTDKNSTVWLKLRFRDSLGGRSLPSAARAPHVSRWAGNDI